MEEKKNHINKYSSGSENDKCSEEENRMKGKRVLC
jgi:hypothetical protein